MSVDLREGSFETDQNNRAFFDASCSFKPVNFKDLQRSDFQMSGSVSASVVLSEEHYCLKKIVRKGLRKTLALDMSGSKTSVEMTLSLQEKAEFSDLPEQTVICSTKHGNIKFYNLFPVLQALTGIEVRVPSVSSDTSRHSNKPLVAELLSIALARLPKEFKDTFGILAENKLAGNQADIKPSVSTQCLSLSLRSKDLALQCYLESTASIFLKLLNSLHWSQVDTNTAKKTKLKHRIPCSAGCFTLTKCQLDDLSPGDMVFLDQPFLDENTGLSLTINKTQFSLVPRDKTIDTFDIVDKKSISA